jgi:REP element-mobilizing transposase RayT
MTYNPEIHHRRSVRLKEYDYSSCGAYFMTICVQGRESLFGEIINGGMRLNDAGRMVATVWHALPRRFPHVALDEFVVMPNHVHGIILLGDRRGEPCVRPVYHRQDHAGEHKVRPYYGTADFSLGRVCQAFKSLTTVEYWRGVNDHNWPPFSGHFWQRNYYERIIRDEKELAVVREYIRHNPSKWEKDEENPANHL